MTKFLLGVLIALPLSATALVHNGSEGGGGGDSCEERFKSVAQDLRVWIQRGGPAALKLDARLTVSSYSNAMLAAIGGARITCVGPDDVGYPVTVNGQPKECVNFVDDAHQARIVCDREKFYSGRARPDNDPAQYKIVHHEYASLAGIEPANGDDSNYAVSQQITSFLEDQMIKKLVVKAPSPQLGQVFRKTHTPREAVVAVNRCLYAQVQNVTDQIQAGKSSVRVSPFSTEADWTPTELGEMDNERPVAPEINAFAPSPLDVRWSWGRECSDLNVNAIGIDSAGQLNIGSLILNKTDCSTTFATNLISEPGALPTLAYDKSHRREVYSNMGDELYYEEPISEFILIPSNVPDPARIRLLNSVTGQPSKITFNAQQYASCLRQKLGF